MAQNKYSPCIDLVIACGRLRALSSSLHYHCEGLTGLQGGSLVSSGAGCSSETAKDYAKALLDIRTRVVELKLACDNLYHAITNNR